MNRQSEPLYYLYKRWLWVQFPWCTIYVFADFSEIMDCSAQAAGESLSNAQEQKLVNDIKKFMNEAKARKNKLNQLTRRPPRPEKPIQVLDMTMFNEPSLPKKR